MVNLCHLLEKYSHFSKIDDDVFVYIDHILENAFEIHRQQQKVKSDIERLNNQLEEKRKCTAHLPDDSPLMLAKKRKVRSADVSFAARKENVSILDDSSIFPYKSDPETSAVGSSVLEQNILDSEESFFALTQSPPKREALSPRNATRSERSPLKALKSATTSTKATGSLLRASRLSSSSFASSEPAAAIEPKPTVSSTPTSTSGKWTAKKQNLTPKAEHTPSGLKRFHSLVDGSSRLRQTKLKFPETDNVPVNREAHSPAHGDNLFSEFVVPTPPSVANKSKFLKSLRSKKQSTMIATDDCDRRVGKSASMGKEKSAEANGPGPTDDDYDIDQTFCPGAEGNAVKIKQEPPSQHKLLKSSKPSGGVKVPALDPGRNGSNDMDVDSSGVFIVSSSQETIISIADTQPTKSELFMAALNEERDKRKEVVKIDLPSMAAKINRDKQVTLPTLAPTITSRTVQGLCMDCTKLYQFHTSCGVSDDTARSRLPRNCRSCRLAQLHSTPPGFWDPDFLPTQR